MLLSFRADISKSGEEGWTPLHEACRYNIDNVAIFLIKAEQQWVRKAEGQEQDVQPGRVHRQGQQDTPSYNMRDKNGLSPVFWTASEKIVEAMLELHDLLVTTRRGVPLLWNCATYGCVSQRVASDPKLVAQYGQRWLGRLPLEEGENEPYGGA